MTDYPAKDTGALRVPPVVEYPAPNNAGEPSRPIAPLPVNGPLSPDDADLI